MFKLLRSTIPKTRVLNNGGNSIGVSGGCGVACAEHAELQYLNLVRDILERGDRASGRNGTTYHRLGTLMKFPLYENTLPLMTTKKLAWKTCLKELLWFISGDTSNETLLNQNVNIWDKNAKVSYITKNHALNDLGPIYGHQWRHFNADYNDCYTDYTDKGVDQLAGIIKCLKDPLKRSSRRLIISAWNPCQLPKMVLPPCHVLMQFNVRAGKYLSCSLYQRSGDIGLGVPFNIASYSFLTHLLAHHCDLIPEKFVYNLGNAHIYENHLLILEKQIDNKPYEFPKVKIHNKYCNIEDYKTSDFIIEDYQSHSKIKMDMIK